MRTHAFGVRFFVYKCCASTYRFQLFEAYFANFSVVCSLGHDLLHPSSADHPSLVRPYWRDTLAVTVNGFTGRAQIRHFVMAITGR
jgi:hypothetical protein